MRSNEFLSWSGRYEVWPLPFGLVGRALVICIVKWAFKEILAALQSILSIASIPALSMAVRLAFRTCGLQRLREIRGWWQSWRSLSLRRPVILDYFHVFCLIVDLYCGPGLVFDSSSRLLALGNHVKVGDVFE